MALLAGFDAHAITKDLDYIVAIVDDDVVLASELVSRLDTVRKQMAAANMPMPPSDVLFNQMLERLIMEEIQLQMGQRAGVRIDDETLTSAIENIAKQNNMTIEQFTQALEHDGVNYREFREEVRREMIIQRTTQPVNNRTTRPTRRSTRFWLHCSANDAVHEYRAGYILIAVADDAPSDGVTLRRGSERPLCAAESGRGRLSWPSPIQLIRGRSRRRPRLAQGRRVAEPG